MARTRLISRRVTATLAIIFLIPAVIFFLLWTSIPEKAGGLTDQARVIYFLAYLPIWLQDMNLVHGIAMGSSAISLWLALRSITKRLVAIRVLMLISILAALFLIAFNLHQMMEIK
ncbi:MAG: hypothetical protein KGM98_03800 [Bacteroidota bacterium]|nr:hypothetical protein [Bacteroidota bacterium]